MQESQRMPTPDPRKLADDAVEGGHDECDVVLKDLRGRPDRD